MKKDTLSLNKVIDIFAQVFLLELLSQLEIKLALEEINLALKDAEIFMEYLLNIKIYIKTKSGFVFSAIDVSSGTIINENGEAIIDLSSVSDVQTLPPSTPYSFNVKVSGIIEPSDIETIYVSQRIIHDFPEFKKRIVLGHR